MLQRVHSPSIETKLLKSSKPLEPKRESFGNGRDSVPSSYSFSTTSDSPSQLIPVQPQMDRH